MKVGIIIGVVFAIFFAFALGIVFEYSVQDKEFPFFEPFTSDEDMWANIMAAYPNYDTMTDLEKTTALRTWASQHMYVSGVVNVYNHNEFNNTHPYEIFNHFSVFHNGNAGVMCSGYAHALGVLYIYAGFPALKYDYGREGCSHSVTLVRIVDTGAPKIIVQDAYFDYYYAWPNGTTMSVYEVFEEVLSKRYDNIVPVYEKTVDYGVFIPFTGENTTHLGVPPRELGIEHVVGIDADSAVYRFWYTPENYHKSSYYVAAKKTQYGESASDLDALVEKRLIIYFSDTISRQEDFSILERVPT